MSDRDELIPQDLAPRITQMVVDDLRAAGWTITPPVEPPIICDHERIMGRGDEVVCYDCGKVLEGAPPVPPSTALRDRMRVRTSWGRQPGDPDVWEDLSTVSEVDPRCTCEWPLLERPPVDGSETCARCGGVIENIMTFGPMRLSDDVP